MSRLTAKITCMSNNSLYVTMGNMYVELDITYRKCRRLKDPVELITEVIGKLRDLHPDEDICLSQIKDPDDFDPYISKDPDGGYQIWFGSMRMRRITYGMMLGMLEDIRRELVTFMN